QAEDGIRDKLVTGVQTCALPISRSFLITPISPTVTSPTWIPTRNSGTIPNFLLKRPLVLCNSFLASISASRHFLLFFRLYGQETTTSSPTYWYMRPLYSIIAIDI